jgi:hypothetical protein
MQGYKGLNKGSFKETLKREEMPKDKATERKEYHCSNTDCGKSFDKPVIIKFCPYCYAEIQEYEEHCQHWFGYLGEKQDGKGIPPECNECSNTIQCLLSKRASTKAANEISKWFP